MENINPNKKTSQTQNSKILKALLNGERLTQLDAYTRFNCTRLGARIYDIKNTDSRLDMERLFDPEFVASLSDREKFIAYEGIKQQLIEQGASQEEYDRVTEQAIEELEI